MLNLYHLQYFLDAAKLKSLSLAAKKNRVSQSAVSQAVRSLELSLGVVLTSHEKKSFHLTEEGRRVAELGKSVFDSVEVLRSTLNDEKNGVAGEVAIGCTNSIAMHFVTRELGRLCAEHPRLRPRLRIGNSDTLTQWLLEDQIDLALMIDSEPLPKGFVSHALQSGKYVLFRSSLEGPKSGLERVVVTRSGREEVQDLIRQSQRRKLKFEILCELTSWETIRSFVRETPGCVGLCPDYVIRSDLREGQLRAVKTAFEMPSYELILAHRKSLGKNASLVATRLRARK